MKKNILIIITLTLFYSLFYSYTSEIFAETSFSAAARCFMPYYITLPNGKRVLADEQPQENKNTNLSQTKKEQNQQIAEEPNEEQLEKQEDDKASSIQQEEIILENQKEKGIITTVCAK